MNRKQVAALFLCVAMCIGAASMSIAGPHDTTRAVQRMGDYVLLCKDPLGASIMKGADNVTTVTCPDGKRFKVKMEESQIITKAVIDKMCGGRHGGVNMSYWMDSQARVICNDGSQFTISTEPRETAPYNDPAILDKQRTTKR